MNKALADFAQRGWLRLEGKSVLIADSERLRAGPADPTIRRPSVRLILSASI